MRSSASKIIRQVEQKTVVVDAADDRRIGGAELFARWRAAPSLPVFDADDDRRQFFGRQGAAADLRCRLLRVEFEIQHRERSGVVGNQLLRQRADFIERTG